MPMELYGTSTEPIAPTDIDRVCSALADGCLVPPERGYQDLAEKIGVSNVAVKRWSNGRATCVGPVALAVRQVAEQIESEEVSWIHTS